MAAGRRTPALVKPGFDRQLAKAALAGKGRLDWGCRLSAGGNDPPGLETGHRGLTGGSINAATSRAAWGGGTPCP